MAIKKEQFRKFIFQSKDLILSNPFFMLIKSLMNMYITSSKIALNLLKS